MDTDPSGGLAGLQAQRASSQDVGPVRRYHDNSTVHWFLPDQFILHVITNWTDAVHPIDRQNNHQPQVNYTVEKH